MLFIWAVIWRECFLLSEFSKSWKKYTNVVRQLLTSVLFYLKSTFCIFSYKSISRKHFRRRFFVSCKFLNSLANKTGWNTKFCKNFLTWCTKLEKKLKKLKKKYCSNFSSFPLFWRGNCFYFLERKRFLERKTILSEIFSTMENKRRYLKLWMGYQNWDCSKRKHHDDIIAT